jgi:hypothetical protein
MNLAELASNRSHHRGERHVDPAAGRLTLGEYVTTWQSGASASLHNGRRV